MKIQFVILIDVIEDIKGGAERQVYDFLRTINKKKFMASLFILHQDFVPKEILQLNIPVTALDVKRIYDFHGLKKGLFFRRYLKKYQVDILMTYHFGSDIWGTIFGKLAKIPMIISNRRDAGFWRNQNHIRAYRFINRWVTKIFGNSEAVRKMVIEQEHVSKENVKIFYNGVDLERFDSKNISRLKKENLNIPEKSKIIMCVGNLRAVKGHIFLIEAAEGVIRMFPEAHFVFIGEGELHHSLKEKAKELSIKDQVHFIGKRDDVPSLLDLADICVLPSLSEGFSNTLLEYMAAARPVVATNAGGNKDIIQNGKNGLLVEPKNSKALEEQMIYLFNHPETAQEFGKQAKEDIIKNFSLTRQTDDVERFLTKLQFYENSTSY